MKIGILTQPLTNNYGGIFQAYALQYVLKQLGHTPLTIDRTWSSNFSFLIKIASVINRCIKYIFISKKTIIRVTPTKKEKFLIEGHFQDFIKNNINMSSTINSSRKMNSLEKYNFDAYIVGSDQCWRPCYSPDIKNYFLDFIYNKKNIKRISYAASFGVDNWEFSEKETLACRSLVQKFDAVSVREDSGVNLCRKYLGVSATHVLDPTMLLRREDYMNLIAGNNFPKRENLLTIYILDSSKEKKNIIGRLSKHLNLQENNLMPEKRFKEVGYRELNKCVFMSIEEWIASFFRAKFIVTDSFHGTVFSIIFNKPFLVFDNEKRGSDRICSLLKLFDLDERIFNDTSDIEHILNKNIDYEDINKRLDVLREQSINFITKYIR